jgi:pyridoxal phosphate enzyme (YggS family)
MRGLGLRGMNIDVDGLRSNLASIEQRIVAACSRAGRKDSPRLLAASKYFDVDQMGLLAQAGIGLVGENRAEGLETKWDRWQESFEFHFIGHLQSRKVRQVLPYVSLIHSVESISLVEELDRRAETEVRVLLEVNVSGEESKYGILPAVAETFLERASAHRRVRFAGLMTMAPLTPDTESTRSFFRELRELRDRLAVAFTGRYELTELSMGMSNDYEVAVEEGATILRIGSALLSDAQGG